MRDVRSLIEESGMGSEAVMLVPEVTEGDRRPHDCARGRLCLRVVGSRPGDA